MSKIWQNIIILTSLALMIAGNNLYTVLWHGFYYQCHAAAILLISYVVLDFMKTKAAKIFFWLSLFNFADEIIFEPTGVYISEYVVAAIVSVFIIFKKQKNARQQQ